MTSLPRCFLSPGVGLMRFQNGRCHGYWGWRDGCWRTSGAVSIVEMRCVTGSAASS